MGAADSSDISVLIFLLPQNRGINLIKYMLFVHKMILKKIKNNNSFFNDSFSLCTLIYILFGKMTNICI